MLKSSLGKHQINSPLTDDELFNLKRNAWHDEKGLNLNAEQIKNLSTEHQWSIEIIGNLVYGRQK